MKFDFLGTLYPKKLGATTAKKRGRGAWQLLLRSSSVSSFASYNGRGGRRRVFIYSSRNSYAADVGGDWRLWVSIPFTGVAGRLRMSTSPFVDDLVRPFSTRRAAVDYPSDHRRSAAVISSPPPPPTTSSTPDGGSDDDRPSPVERSRLTAKRFERENRRRRLQLAEIRDEKTWVHPVAERAKSVDLVVWCCGRAYIYDKDCPAVDGERQHSSTARN